jgi:hypothetical protein
MAGACLAWGGSATVIDPATSKAPEIAAVAHRPIRRLIACTPSKTKT